MLPRLALIAVCLTLSGCSLLAKHLPLKHAPVKADRPPESLIEQAAYTPDEQPCVVYVMSNGFHTGLIFKTADVPETIWPELGQLPSHRWTEVGWGSEIFYRAKKITPEVIVGALVPNPSVLHIVGWDGPPTEVFPGDLIRLEISPDRFARMCRYIQQSYRRSESGLPEDLGTGIYGDDSRFFRARGLYYFPKTCNVWTARALDVAEVPIVPALCSTADSVLNFAARSGTVLQRR